mgnify:CR=1 FL=1
MIRTYLLVVLICFAAQSARAQTPPLRVTGKIDSVTVFSDRALVRRVQVVPAEKGSGVVRFHSLPVALVRDSVRAAGKEVTITGVAVRATEPVSEREWLNDPLKLAVDQLDQKLSAERDRVATFNEQLRLLGNLENPRLGKLLQIVLAGQPELDRKLDAPNLRQLKQRIVLRCGLAPFSLAEAVEYIYSRLTKAGMTDHSVFPEDVLKEVHLRSQGIPRLINAICDNLLLTAFALEQKTTTIAMLDEVCHDMRLEWPGRRVRGRSSFPGDPSDAAPVLSPREQY